MVRPSKQLHPWREPATPRPAATVLLLRDGPTGLEVLMTRRSMHASFAPGAYVFPGGTLDPADRVVAASPLAVARDDQDPEQRAYAWAALREAFEELGILLADTGARASAGASPHWPSGRDVEAMQRTPESDLAEQLAARGWSARLDRLHWWSHWITDRDLPKRFDARFFVAAMPEGQVPIADEGEQFEPVWVHPADGLERHARGEFNIIFPTIRTLRQLTAFGGVAQVLERAREQDATGRRFFSCPRQGRMNGEIERFSEHEMPYGELQLVAPDGREAPELDWQHLRPVRLLRHVQRLTAPNPGLMTGPGTNTWIVGEPGAYAVIDPGPDLPEHVARIAQAVGEDLRWILCTHSHPDHSPAAARLHALTGAPVAGMASGPHAREHSSFVPQRALADGEAIVVGDSTLRAIHTPGHAANHLCFLLEEDGLLFSGDHIMNGSTVVIDPPDGDMHAYLASLRRLAALEFDYVLPAHGWVLAPAKAEIERLIAHRLAREAKVRRALHASGPAGGTLESLVPLAYDDVPERLHPVARRSLLAHLGKLVADGEATEAPAGCWRLAAGATTAGGGAG